MSVFQAFVLGLVQGVTEFLPISSSGHLILVPELFGWPAQSLAFDAMVHVATLGAVITAFRQELRQMWQGARKGMRGGLLRKGGMSGLMREPWARLGAFIIIATLPVVGFGIAFKAQVESALRTPEVVAASLALWGIALYIADRQVGKRADAVVTDISLKRALFIGFMQAIALIPGTSRSGITITAGLFSGLNREAATRFAFLLGVPAIAGAGALAGWDVARHGTDITPAAMAAGFLGAFVSGLLAIRFLLALLRRGTFAGFAIYRLILAAYIVIILL